MVNGMAFLNKLFGKKNKDEEKKSAPVVEAASVEDSEELTEEEIAARRAEYVENSGEEIFEGVTEEVVYEQFLRDKFIEEQIAVMEEKGNITYK